MKTIFTWAWITGCLLTMAFAGVKEDRAKAKALRADGNWKEALAISETLLSEISDEKSGDDFDGAMACAYKLPQGGLVDGIFDLVDEHHLENTSVLLKAGNMYHTMGHDGMVIGGEFIRGRRQWQQGAEYGNAKARDRVRGLNYLIRALKLTKENRKNQLILKGLRDLLVKGRQNNQSWRLQILTDLNEVPEIDVTSRYYHYSSSTGGAPVDENNNPIFYEIPQSWDEAKNDGERWRWTMDQEAQIKKDMKSDLDRRWADFLWNQFGVKSLKKYRSFRSWGMPHNDDEENQNGIMQLHTLGDDETVCRLATGVKRMKLPEGQNFITIYRKLYEGGSSSAGDRLVSIYLDRRQHVKASHLLKEIIQRDPSKQRKDLLKSIEGNWGQFDALSRAFPAGEEPTLSMVYRNANEVTFSAFKVDMEKLHQDRWQYLKSNPAELDYDHKNLNYLTGKLINQRYFSRYIGEKAGEHKHQLKPTENHWDVRGDFTVPVKKAGTYLVKAEMAESDPFYTIVTVADFVLLQKSTPKGILAIVTDATTGAPVEGASVEYYGYRTKYLKKQTAYRSFDVVTAKQIARTDEDGQALIQPNENNYQWTVRVSKGEKLMWSHTNGHYWRNGYSDQTHHKVGAFGMTSQPVYRPGKLVQGKFWVRKAKYDLKEQSEFSGQNFTLEIKDPKGNQVGQTFAGFVDEFGGVPFEVELEKAATLGSYHVSLTVGSNYVGNLQFRVEEFKKPEYEVKVEAPEDGVILGETFEATVKATYYHGAPVTKAKVKVKVLRHDYSKVWYPWGKWDWLYGGGYGWFDIERHWYPGWRYWGCRCPKPFWMHQSWHRPELVFEREMEIGTDGTVKVMVDTELAKLMHGEGDHRYEITAEVVDASRRTIFGSGQVLATQDPYKVTVWLNRGYAQVGEKVTAQIAARTLDGKVIKAQGKAVLYKVTYKKNGTPKEEKVQEWEVAQFDEMAKIDISAKEAGQYRFVATLKDQKEREVSGAVLFTVRGDHEDPGDFRYNALELITDERTYAVGDTVKLLVNTNRADSTVWVFVRGNGERHLLKLKGKSQVLEIPVKGIDMPNFFVEAVTVSDAQMHTAIREVIVPPEKRILEVSVLPDQQKYKPGDQGKVKVQVTGAGGEPIQGEVVLAVYDKALEYISAGSNVGNIKDFFWKWRRHYYGDTSSALIVHERSSVKTGKKSMNFLGAFGANLADDVNAREDRAKARGAMLARDAAGSGGGFGNITTSVQRKPSAPSASIEQPTISVRKNFADAIKWQGKVILDENGIGVVEVEYPDNLTTWKVKAWAMAHGTRVGEGSAEVITSKDLIVRLQAPRFFIEKDEVVLSAVVHNYHKTTKEVRVSLDLKGGTLSTNAALEQTVSLAADGGEQRVNWRVKVDSQGEAIVQMKVIAEDDADAMEMTFPVHVHGIPKQFAWSRVIEPGADKAQITIKVPEERLPEESFLQVNYSPSIAGAVVDALPYLAEFPHGCTEQTLNRFVPTVITQKLLMNMGIDLEEVRNKRVNLNPQELGDAKARAAQWKQWKRNPVFDAKEVDKMTQKGVERLMEMQLRSGGWGWFSGYGEHASAHTTAVVMHGLTLARANGVQVPEQSYQQGLNWLKRYEANEAERIRMWKKRKKNTKHYADQRDAFVRLVLDENKISNTEMQGFLFRDKNELGVYGKCLLGMSLHLNNEKDLRDRVIRNIEQFLTYDEENQTAVLEMGNGGYWWYWYGSNFEAHAWYLKLKSATAPQSREARGVVKYLVNNRKGGAYWSSTRDTAYCIEAIADYMKASGESSPNCEIEVLFDGKVIKTVKVTKENLFHFDSKMTLAGDILSSGDHLVTIRRKGEGALYTNAYLKVFTKEDFIEKTGLEVKVARQFYKLVRDESKKVVAGNRGQVVEQQEDRYTRIPLVSGDEVQSGDIIEVELLIESKNDYEYLLFEDWKAAGMEAEKVRSGYLSNYGLRTYMEVRDEKVSFYVQNLSRGKHSLSYRLRAEIPGKFSALPTVAEAMYAPELRANSDEMKVEISE